jgi:capsular exopolysaccharide synthesis family protein
MGKFFQVLQRAEQQRNVYRQLEESGQGSRKSAVKVSAPLPVQEEPKREEEEPRSAILENVDPHLAGLLAPASLEAERYRTICCNLEQLHKETGLAVLAVSSPGVGDGKTTTAINLAATLAQTPEIRVLLIDMDLRRPSVAAALGLKCARSQGVVSVLTNPLATFDEGMWKWPSLNLSILPAGRAQSMPHEILKSPRLGDFLAEARRRYDYVVLDTPPLAPFPDCKLLGQWVDGFLMVVAAHRTPRKLIEEALATMEPAKFVGIVFNYEDRAAHKYYYYYNSYSAPNGKRSWWPFRRSPSHDKQ